ncbi:hypothetical protein Q0590_10935 [Rhodocytophaga aerolata]|uniref:LEA type 2 family protein n=1 Tax=Rhodocytophaga aerolata TaxID=455078 RepID=A0ABT8R7W5_9BACT|nr:LEA type 2 family protein [Rhodocytophaga aerolata]MDO1446770.1 hypothetical protein [Rhodocytophaga aerolata]
MKEIAMRVKTSIFVLFVLFTSISCRQLKELQTFANCDFRLANLENTTLAGINVQNVRSISDLNLVQAAKITQSYASGSLPLNLIVNMEVKNPNATTAAMNSVDWIMVIDDKEIVDGTINERVQIAPDGGVTTLPIRISTDLRKVLSGMPAEQAVNMGLGLSGNGGKPTRVTLKIKPSIMVGQTVLKYPGYINVNQDFGGSSRQ